MLSLVLALTIGQTVKLPATVSVEVGRLAAVAVDYDGDDCRWDIPPDLDAFREYDPDPKKIRLRLIGYKAGTHRIIAVACKGGKLSELAACVVTVGKPGPGPKPPEPEPEPEPDEPVVTEMARRVTAKIESLKPERPIAKAEAARIAKVLRDNRLNTKIKTMEELSDAIRKGNQDAFDETDESWWRANFFVWLMGELKAAKIDTLEKYRIILGDVATGLEAVK